MKKPLLIFFLVVVAVIETVWILKSNGFYYIDELSHYLYCRFVLQALPMTVQTWHRPIPQWLFALPAQFGHTFTMFFACGLFLCLLYIIYRIAILHGIKHAEWVIILVGLQPILFDLSYACMTEVPAAFMISLSYFYHLKKKHGWSMALASAVILCRSEMYIFAGLMFLVYAYKREWKILPLVLVGPLLWIGSTTLISGNIMTFFTEWKHFSNLGKFIPGVSVTHYIGNLHTTFGFAQVVLFLAGTIFIYRARKNDEYGILYATIAMTIILHTLAGADIFHWTASIGELRYIAVVGPFFGIVSVYGLSGMLDRVKSSGGRFAFSILVFGVVVLNCTLTTHPRRWPIYDQVVINLTKIIKNEYPNLTLLSNNSNAAYVMDVSPAGGPHFAMFNKKTLEKYPECLILWDPFSSYSIFFQTELTKENVLKDTTIRVLERYNYWSAEYLVLYKH
ncbi:MAG: hypothetical protein ABR936_12980 [Bacteroidota bacterium]